MNPNNLPYLCPYSLGKLIEWKPEIGYQLVLLIGTGPYSLGKLIEWKPGLILVRKGDSGCPYSLGKLIEWKR